MLAQREWRSQQTDRLSALPQSNSEQLLLRAAIEQNADCAPIRARRCRAVGSR
jgi:hypothetical protein